MSDNMLNTLLNVIIIAGTMVLIFNYAYGNNTGEGHEISNITDNGSSVAQTYAPKTTKILNTSLEQINMSLATENDKQLIYLIIEGDNTLKNDMIKSANAAKNEDYKSFEMSGIIMKDDSQKYLDKINNINVSSPFKTLFNEYKHALENFYKAGGYIETGSRNPLSKDIEKSIDRINDANAYISNAYYIIKLDRSESSRFLSNMSMSNMSVSNTNISNMNISNIGNNIHTRKNI